MQRLGHVPAPRLQGGGKKDVKKRNAGLGFISHLHNAIIALVIGDIQ